jgi:1,2-diacylglycerol 3-alpha-glucosyltransferase
MIFGQFNDSFPPVIDGVANVAMNYASILNEKFGQCYMVTPWYESENNYPFQWLSFRSYPAPGRPEYRWGLGQLDYSFWRSVSRIPFDIVHAHSPFSSGLVARQIARARNIPFVTTFHSKYRDDFLDVVKSEILVTHVMIKSIVNYYESADEVWTVNEASAGTLREYGYKGDIFVFSNGCDMPVTERTPAIEKSVRKQYGFENPDPILMYIGQLIPQKNLKLITESLKMLQKDGCGFNMLFIGDGSSRPQLESSVKQAGLADRIKFTGKVADRETVRQIYAAAEVMLFPSLYDTSSLVPREAAACQCPTLFVQGSNTAEGIIHGEDGFLAQNNAADYAEKIKQIIQNKELTRRVGEGAYVSLYRPWPDVVSKAHERYLFLIDKKNSTTKMAR